MRSIMLGTLRSLFLRKQVAQVEAETAPTPTQLGDPLLSPEVTAARMAVARADYAAAENFWITFRAKFPDEPTGYVGLAEALRSQNRIVEAEKLLSTVVDRFMAHRGIVVTYALL